MPRKHLYDTVKQRECDAKGDIKITLMNGEVVSFPHELHDQFKRLRVGDILLVDKEDVETLGIRVVIFSIDATVDDFRLPKKIRTLESLPEPENQFALVS